MARRQFFTTSDLARIFGEERARAKARHDETDEAAAVAAARPVSVTTVYAYLRYSRNGRYVTVPMPMPIYIGADGEEVPVGDHAPVGRHPVWVPGDRETLDDLERRLRSWWHSRPGQGVGGGPKRRTDMAKVDQARELLARPGATVVGVADEVGLSKWAVNRYARGGAQ